MRSLSYTVIRQMQLRGILNGSLNSFDWLADSYFAEIGTYAIRLIHADGARSSKGERRSGALG